MRSISRDRSWSRRGAALLIALGFVLISAPAWGQNQQVVWQLPGIGTAVAFTPDGLGVLAGSQLRRTSDGGLIQTFNLRHGGEVNAAQFSPNGQYVAIGVQTFNLNLNFFRVSDGMRIVPSNSHNNGVTTVSFSPDGQFLATGGRDGTVKLWHVPEMTLLNTFLGGAGYSANVYAVVFSADGQYLAAGGAGGLVILRLSDGKIVRTLVSGAETVRGLALSPDGSTLAAGFFTTPYAVKVWRFADGALLGTFTGGNQPVNTVAFDPNSKIVSAGGGDDAFAGILRFLRASDMGQVGYFPQDPNNLNSYIRSVAYSPKGQYVAYARADYFVVLARNPFAGAINSRGDVAAP